MLQEIGSLCSESERETLHDILSDCSDSLNIVSMLDSLFNAIEFNVIQNPKNDQQDIQSYLGLLQSESTTTKDYSYPDKISISNIETFVSPTHSFADVMATETNPIELPGSMKSEHDLKPPTSRHASLLPRRSLQDVLKTHNIMSIPNTNMNNEQPETNGPKQSTETNENETEITVPTILLNKLQSVAPQQNVQELKIQSARDQTDSFNNSIKINQTKSFDMEKTTSTELKKNATSTVPSTVQSRDLRSITLVVDFNALNENLKQEIDQINSYNLTIKMFKNIRTVFRKELAKQFETGFEPLTQRNFTLLFRMLTALCIQAANQDASEFD